MRQSLLLVLLLCSCSLWAVRSQTVAATIQGTAAEIEPTRVDIGSPAPLVSEGSSLAQAVCGCSGPGCPCSTTRVEADEIVTCQGTGCDMGGIDTGNTQEPEIVDADEVEQMSPVETIPRAVRPAKFQRGKKGAKVTTHKPAAHGKPDSHPAYNVKPKAGAHPQPTKSGAAASASGAAASTAASATVASASASAAAAVPSTDASSGAIAATSTVTSSVAAQVAAAPMPVLPTASYAGITVDPRNTNPNAVKVAQAAQYEKDKAVNATTDVQKAVNDVKAALAREEDARVTKAKADADKDIQTVRDELEAVKGTIAKINEEKDKTVRKAQDKIREQETKEAAVKTKQEQQYKVDEAAKKEVDNKAEAKNKKQKILDEERAKRNLVYDKLKMERDEALEHAKELQKKAESEAKARVKALDAAKKANADTVKSIELLKTSRAKFEAAEEQRVKALEKEHAQRVIDLNASEEQRTKERDRVEAIEKTAAAQRDKQLAAEEQERKAEEKAAEAEQKGSEGERKTVAKAMAARMEEADKTMTKKALADKEAQIAEQKAKETTKQLEAAESVEKAKALAAKYEAEKTAAQGKIKEEEAKAAALANDQAAANKAEEESVKARTKAASADAARIKTEQAEKASEAQMKNAKEADAKASSKAEATSKDKLASQRIAEEAEKAKAQAAVAAVEKAKVDAAAEAKTKQQAEEATKQQALEKDAQIAYEEALPKVTAAIAAVDAIKPLKTASDDAQNRAQNSQITNLLAYAGLLSDSAKQAELYLNATKTPALNAADAKALAEKALSRASLTKKTVMIDTAETLLRRITASKAQVDDMQSEAQVAVTTRKAAAADALKSANDSAADDEQRSKAKATEEAAEKKLGTVKAAAVTAAAKVLAQAAAEANTTRATANAAVKTMEDDLSKATGENTAAGWNAVVSRVAVTANAIASYKTDATETSDAAEKYLAAAKDANSADQLKAATDAKTAALTFSSEADRLSRRVDDVKALAAKQYAAADAAEKAEQTKEATNKAEAQQKEQEKLKAEQTAKEKEKQEAADEHRSKADQRGALSTASGLKLESGFDSYGHGYRMPQMSLQGNLCFLSGAVANTQSRLTKMPLMFSVPDVCRPKGTLRFGARTSAGKQIELQILADGRVNWAVSDNVDPAVFLDGIAWPAAAGNLTALDLTPAVANRPAFTAAKGFAAPTVMQQNTSLCVLSGSVSAPSTPHTDVGVVPAACRPAAPIQFRLHHSDPKGSPCTMTIQANGRLVLDCPVQSAYSLDGIVYVAGAGGNAVAPMWAMADGFRRPTFSAQNGLCIVSGAARPAEGFQGIYLLQLPASCRPSYGKASFSLPQAGGSIAHVYVTEGGQLAFDTAGLNGAPLDSKVVISLNGITFPILAMQDWEKLLQAAVSKAQRDEEAEAAKAADLYVPKPLDGTRKGAEYRPAGVGLRIPQYSRHGSVCVYSGTVEHVVSGATTSLFKAPAECTSLERIFTMGTEPVGVTYAALARGDNFVVDSVLAGRADAAAQISFDGLVAPVQGSSYLPLPAVGGWVNHNQRTPLHVVIADGLCVLGGRAKLVKADDRAVITALPAECRPADGRLAFHTVSNVGGVVRLDILDGRVVFVEGEIPEGAEYIVSLDGIVFSPTKGNALDLPSTLKPFGQGYRAPSYVRLGKLCIVSGLVGVDNTTATVPDTILLPADCRPKTGDMRFFSGRNTANNRIDVSADGKLSVKRAVKSWFSLTGVTFIVNEFTDWEKTEMTEVASEQEARKAAADAAAIAAKVTIASGQSAYGLGYRAPQTAMHGSACIISGELSVNPHNGQGGVETLASLPAQCKPATSDDKVSEIRVSEQVGQSTATMETIYTPGALTLTWSDGNNGGLYSLGGIVVPTGKEYGNINADNDTWAGSFFEAAGKSGVGLYRDSNLCTLTGRVAAKKTMTADSYVMLNLPAGCHPAENMIFYASYPVNNSRTIRVDVSPLGVVSAVGALTAGKTLYLNNIAYLVSPTKPRSLALLSWLAGDVSPYMMRDRDLCTLGGQVKLQANSTDAIASIPADCRPSSRVSFTVQGSTRLVRVDVTTDGKVYFTGSNIKVVEWLSLDGVRFMSSAPPAWETEYNKQQLAVVAAEQATKGAALEEQAVKKVLKSMIPYTEMHSITAAARTNAFITFDDKSAAKIMEAADKATDDVKKAFTWQITNGLYGSGDIPYVSFSSRTSNDKYLVATKETVSVVADGKTEQSSKQATYLMSRAKVRTDEMYMMFESVAEPGYFLWSDASTGDIKLKTNDNSAQFNSGTAFKLVDPRWSAADEARERAAEEAKQAEIKAREGAVKAAAEEDMKKKMKAAFASDTWASFEHMPNPDYFIKHADFNAVVAKVKVQQDRLDTTWQVTAPLAKINDLSSIYISLRSANYPERYLRLTNEKELRLLPFDNTDAFSAAATFKVVEGLANKDKGYVSFESNAFPENYLRVVDWKLVAAKTDGSDTFGPSASFRLLSPRWDPKIVLGSGWEPYGGEFTRPYWDTQGRVCVLHGEAYSADVYSAIGTLPEDCQPSSSLLFDSHLLKRMTTNTLITKDGAISSPTTGGEDDSVRKGYRTFGGIVFPVKGSQVKPVPLADRWQNFGQGYATLSYFRQDDLCVLNGYLQRTSSWNDLLGTLPPDCRPADGHMIFNANRGRYTARVDINTDGTIWYRGQNDGSRDFAPTISLDGVAFVVTKGTALALSTGWGNFWGGWRTLSYHKIDRICVVSGGVTGAPGHGTIAQLPAECRPHTRMIFHVSSESRTMRVDVLPSGVISYVDGDMPSSWMSLSGIIFTVGTAKMSGGATIDNTPLTNRTLKLLNGFEAHTDSVTLPYRAPTAHRYGSVCLLSGLAAATQGVNNIIANMPEFCMPEGGQRVYNSAGAGVQQYRIDLQGDGVLKWGGGWTGGNWMSLAGIVFPANGTRLNTIALESPYVSYGKGFQDATWFVQDDYCVLSGVVRHNTFAVIPGGLIGQLPPECRPRDGRLIFAVSHDRYTHRVDIEKDGKIWWVSGSRNFAWIALDGIAFYVTSADNRLDLAQGWGNYGGSYRLPSFRKEGQICALSGLMTGPGNSRMIARLPLYCRPEERLVFFVSWDARVIRVDVLDDGRLMWVDGSFSSWLSLDGIAFITDNNDRDKANVYPIEPAKPQAITLAPNAGLAAFGEGYGVPTYWRAGPMCFLSGVLKGAQLNRILATLPADCRPDARLIFEVFIDGPPGRTTRIDVEKDGTLRWAAGWQQGGWIPLNGISFPVAGTLTGPLPLMHQWVPYGEPYMRPSYSRLGEFCQLSGVIRTDNYNMDYWNNYIMSMPSECKPGDGHLIFHVNSQENSQRITINYLGQMSRDAGYTQSAWMSLSTIQFFLTSSDSPLQLINNWTPYYNDYRLPSYRKQGNLCVLSGLANNGGFYQHMATLPMDCRPKERLIFAVNEHDYNNRIDVMPDGVVYYSGPRYYSWVPLDGVYFMVDAYKPPLEAGDQLVLSQEGKPLALEYGFEPYNEGYRNPIYTRMGPICILSGRARSHDVQRLMAMLPAECTPEKRHDYLLCNGENWNPQPYRTDVLPDGQVKWISRSTVDNRPDGGWVHFDGMIFSVKGQRDLTWKNIPLYGWWEPFGEPFAMPSYTVLDNGLCMLQGELTARGRQSISDGYISRAMPAECRPADGVIIVNADHNGFQNGLYIYPSGDIYWAAGYRQFNSLSLDGIIFHVNKGANVELNPDTRGPYNNGYRIPSWKKNGQLCVLSGLVSGSYNGGVIGTLPAECRPKERLVFSGANHNFARRVDVLPDGRIMQKWDIAYNWISLDGIFFVVPKDTTLPDAYPKDGPGKFGLVELLGESKPFGGEFQAPGYVRFGSLCMLTGMVGTKTIAQQMLKIPQECWPDGRTVLDLKTESLETVRFDIDAFGVVSYVAGATDGSTISLDGVIYPVRGTPSLPVPLRYAWENYGRNYTEAEWVRQGDLCVWTGFIKVSTERYNELTHVIARAPPQCIPKDGRLIFNINFNDFTHRVDLETNGNFQIQAYRGPWNKYYTYSLTGITYMQTSVINLLSMNPGWGPYGGGYRTPSFVVQGDICVLSGLANGNGRKDFARLPADCRPRKQLAFYLNMHEYNVRFDILPDGNMNWISGDRRQSWVSLEGIRFLRQLPAGPPSLIVGLSYPSQTLDAESYPLDDKVWTITNATYPFQDWLGIGNLVRQDMGGFRFALHDHVYSSNYIPNQDRVSVIYNFNQPTVIKSVEILQHTNGISRIELMCSENSYNGPWSKSIGANWGQRGNVQGSGQFPDKQPDYFFFDSNTQACLSVKLFIRQTSLYNGWATYRIYPHDANGRILPARTATEGRTRPIKPNPVMPNPLVVVPNRKAKVVYISVPDNSCDATCTTLNDKLWTASAPINPAKGIGALINTADLNPSLFALHDHVYSWGYIPTRTRSTVITYRFDTPVVIKAIEILQHTNGIDRLRLDVAKSTSGPFVSVGEAWSSLGERYGGSQMTEKGLDIFDFNFNTEPCVAIQVTISQTSLSNGWATYRIWPRDESDRITV